MDSGQIPANSIKFRDIVFDVDVIMQGYIQIKLRNLFPQTTLPCDCFFPTVEESKGKIEPGKVFTRAQEFTEESRHALSQEDIEDIYIRGEDEHAFLNYFYAQMQSAIKSPKIPTGKKTQLLYDNAEIILKKVFREHPNEPNILLGKQLIEDFSVHLENEEVTAKALLSLCSKDYCTYNHCVQVAIIGMSFCKFLGWSKDETVSFGIGALFHDIGKNSISNEILNKPEKLNIDEFELIKQHASFGYQQLLKSRMLHKEQLDIVLYHHEAMDGSGYPEGLFGNKIPRYARLARVIDVFDALSTERAYKSALKQEDALQLMKNEMRTSLDQELLEAFSLFLDKRFSTRTADFKQIGIETGIRVSLQTEPAGARIKTVLVGIDIGNCLIFKVLDSSQLHPVHKGMLVTARYIYAGEACGFQESIIEIASSPFPLIFLSYPNRVEKFNLRREKRADCILPASIIARKKECKCIMLDISFSGCRINIKDTDRGSLPLVLTDEMILISSQLPGSDELVLLKGQVKNLARTDHGTLVGIQFTALSEQCSTSLRHYVGGFCDWVR
ncbi:MAG: HD domain-containing phosphohydrolase [Syntrophobacteraceae bacterium]